MDLEECSQITDATLQHLAAGCPSLEKLVSFKTNFLSVQQIFYNELFQISNICFSDIITL